MYRLTKIFEINMVRVSVSFYQSSICHKQDLFCGKQHQVPSGNNVNLSIDWQFLLVSHPILVLNYVNFPCLVTNLQLMHIFISRNCSMFWRRCSLGHGLDAHVEGGEGEHREGRQPWNDPWRGGLSLRRVDGGIR